MTTGDVAAHLLGIDPARMLASSTSTFITNDKIKTDLIFFFFSVLQWKKAIPVLLFHSLNDYCLLMPHTLLKAQDIKVNYPLPCPPGIHRQKKRSKKQWNGLKVPGETALTMTHIGVFAH